MVSCGIVVVTRSPFLRKTELQRRGQHWQGCFQAMASPCELLTEAHDESLAKELLEAVANEAWRIEDKFSRYLPGNIVDHINTGNGEMRTVDEETANLLDFAASLHGMSNRRFDITSGVLRKAWTFDGGDQLPPVEQIDKILEYVGWDQVTWQRPELTLLPGMQIDFGGIGKEYVVDKAAALVNEMTDASCLVNFGGDLVVTGVRADSRGWQVGIEALNDDSGCAERLIHLERGALATSGDARRYILKDGIRYSHILDPTTGWPIVDAPRSITVAADTCTQAGMLATLAMLKGSDAEDFLQQQGVQFWSHR